MKENAFYLVDTANSQPKSTTLQTGTIHVVTQHQNQLRRKEK